jgi:hypothetical protein
VVVPLGGLEWLPPFFVSFSFPEELLPSRSILDLLVALPESDSVVAGMSRRT